MLGAETVWELWNGYHLWMILIVTLLLVSAFVSLMIAFQIKQRNEWLRKNPCVWPNENPRTGDNQPAPVPTAPTTAPPQNIIVGQNQTNVQKPYPTQQ